ncbi:MAG: two-component regulator propeller domain-containing protein [Cyclobacteriaceae bacterium]
MKFRTCFLALYFMWLNGHGQERLNFQNLTVEDGLSYSLVFEILKDSNGFMWFGSTDGLNKFDGHDFTIYQNVPGDSTSLPDNSVWALFEDSKNNLWVGTDGGGLSMYDRYTDIFTNFKNDPDDPSSLPHNSVNIIIEDSYGAVWIGTYGGGMSKIVAQGKFKNYSFDEGDPKSLSNNFVHDLFEDHLGRLWVGTRHGLNLYDRSTNAFLRTYAGQEEMSLSNDNVLSIAEDEEGILWLGTWGGGLNSLDPRTGDIRQYAFPEESSNRVACVYVDSFNSVWAGFLGEGLVSLDRGTGRLNSNTKDVLNTASLINDNVWFIYEDDLKNLWIGTEGGISRLELDKKSINGFDIAYFAPEFKNTVLTDFDETLDGEILFSTEDEVGIITNSNGQTTLTKLIEVAGIWSILAEEKNIWISSSGSGLFKYRKTGLGYELDRKYLEIKNVSLENPTYLLKGSEGVIWIGTDGSGLVRYTPGDNDFRIYPLLDSTVTNSSLILNVYEDDENTLWIGTYAEGLIRFDKGSGQFERLTSETKEGSISNNTVLSVIQDDEGIMWIGTDGGGLNRLDRATGQVSIKTTQDGLPSNIILGIIEDGENNLWMSTNEGISKYDKTADTFNNYDGSHGLVSQSFNADAFFRDRSGQFYFGSGNGFNVFHPDSIRPSTFVPPVFFSDFKVLNKSIGLTEGILSRHINFEESITLSHKENFFSFNFVALDYRAPSKNLYAYKLEGFNTEWIYTDALDRQATFTNLDHGNYELKVKASNSDGVWGQNTASLQIRIEPPPWKTWWAYSLYFGFFTFMIVLIFRTFLVRERLKTNLEVERLERKKMEELDELKSSFFAGISHEFRTPLTLISAPIGQLLKKHAKDQETGWTLKLVNRNANRLLRLINQLLDLSKLEAGKLKLKVSKSDVVGWMRVVIASFESFSESKEISFQTDLPKEPVMMFFDKEKLEQILVNLLSNAFKFSKTEVELKVKMRNKVLQIEVLNDGEKVHTLDLEKIFDRFYQVNENKTHAEGTGIGLALVKEFTELHHGTVQASSEEGRTAFLVNLPTSDAAYDQDDRVSVGETEVSKAVRQQDELDELSSEITLDQDDRHGILIVEDNEDLRSYMAQQLGDEYQVIEARDGREGLDQALSEIPDLIITDLMMPQIDGVELVKSIRKDSKTNHIPIIMLTAKADKEAKLEGIQEGVDHYLNKPFDMDELLVRAKSLLNQRERIRNHFYSEFIASPTAEDITSMDDQFLEQAVAVINVQLDNHEFTVDQFARELALSRVQLHRKLKAIIGCSASEFIRQYRLKKAHEYLKGKKDTVSRIAYSVGFNNLSYFTKAFKEVYKINPSDLLK